MSARDTRSPSACERTHDSRSRGNGGLGSGAGYAAPHSSDGFCGFIHSDTTMKLTVKTLKGEKFVVEVDESLTVAQTKEAIVSRFRSLDHCLRCGSLSHNATSSTFYEK